MAFHVQTNDSDGTSVIKYQILNKNNIADNADLIFNITYNNTTGIIDNNFSNKIKIYPNPVTSTLNFTGNINLKDYEVRIMNPLGQYIYKQNFTIQTNESIDVSFLQNGIYFLQMVPVSPDNYQNLDVVTDNKIFNLKFIKQ